MVAERTGRSTEAEPALDGLGLQDWKRSITEAYYRVRHTSNPEEAWSGWVETRDHLFAHHHHSPLPELERSSFTGLQYFDYNPAARVLASTNQVESQRLDIQASNDQLTGLTRFARASFQLFDEDFSLDLYWLDRYGGGLFVPFGDQTNGTSTYGAGRYLLDSVKGVDLGVEDGRLILDFNFAYNPSCAYDPKWICPLAPAANRLPFVVRAGERAP